MEGYGRKIIKNSRPGWSWIKPSPTKETFGVKPCPTTYNQTSLGLTAALVHIFEKPLELILPCHWQDNLNPPKLQGKVRFNLHPAPICLVRSQRIITGLSCGPLPKPETQRITILCNLKRSVMVFFLLPPIHSFNLFTCGGHMQVSRGIKIIKQNFKWKM